METISFAGDGLAMELIENEELADCAATAIEREGESILSYGTGAGYTPLRELIAGRYGVHPYRVILTNGWFQGLVMLTHRRARGHDAVIEYPTYGKALDQFFSTGATVKYMDRIEGGLRLEELQFGLRTSQKKVSYIYTIPAFQNPTGTSISAELRWEMYKLAMRFKTPLLEDDTYGLLRFEGDHTPTIFEMSAGGSIYSSSFSYTVAPGLRVGYFILPDEHAREVAAIANGSYISPSLISQATIFEYIQRGSFDRHLGELREALRERRDLITEALGRHLPDAKWLSPEGGIFLMISLPPGSITQAKLDAAEGVSALSGVDCGGSPNTLRLNFAEPALEEIEPGIERLAAALGAVA